MATKRIPLQLKAAVLFVLVVAIPLATAYFAVGQLGKTAANVASSDAALRVDAMDKASHRYHELVNVTKRLHAEIVERLAIRPDIAALDENADLAGAITDPAQAGLRAIALLRPDGTLIKEAQRASSGHGWRDKVVDHPVGSSGAVMRATFEVSATLQDELQGLKGAIDGTRQVAIIQSALPASYTTTFLVLIGLACLAAAVVGIVFSGSITRRLDALVITARKVGDGELDTRSELRGRDELGELGTSFDEMLDNLEESRRQVEYLQRMGVWQDVARKLAHEIKNPLTPIQLAVQQCVSAYKGADTDPTRYTKLLADTGEIVEEEIAALRRLVDTFRTLGALPKVEAAPLALAEVIEELKLDPVVAERLTLTPPKNAVTVRADKLLLKRVLANLVENGIHAGQEAGTVGDVVIGWTADAHRDQVTITVDDHGKGVTEANRQKIFEPYVTTKQTGTGLGLAIARKLAIEHGGELAIAPGPAPTGGARFVVSLPLRGPESSLG